MKKISPRIHRAMRRAHARFDEGSGCIHRIEAGSADS
jgi:hypothetical protein